MGSSFRKACQQSRARSLAWHAPRGTPGPQKHSAGRAPRATPVPWPRHEEEALIEYIITIGSSWSAILRHDRQSRRLDCRRTQGALKDKARIIKYHMLAGSMPLPRNFDRIGLGPVLEAKLARLERLKECN
jgi:hypothetical protein